MDNRNDFFRESLRRLNDASKVSFENLKTQSIHEARLHVKYLLTITPNFEALKSKKIDNVAQNLLPTDHSSKTAIACIGDGNCLYRSGSIISFQNESRHIELRARTVVELALNETFYTCSDINDKSNLKHLAVISHFYDRILPGKINDSVISLIFQLEVVEATSLYTYATMWCMYGMCSVLNINLHSIYPDINPRQKVFLNKLLCPREIDGDFMQRRDIGILWSRIGKQVGNIWQPNHFVPCFKLLSVDSMEKFSGIESWSPTIKILKHDSDDGNDDDSDDDNDDGSYHDGGNDYDYVDHEGHDDKTCDADDDSNNDDNYDDAMDDKVSNFKQLSLEPKFPLLSNRWFYKRGRLAMANKQRDVMRGRREILKSDDDFAIFNFNNFSSNISLQQTKDTLQNELATSNSRNIKTIQGCLNVVNAFMEDSPVFLVQNLVKLYQGKTDSEKKALRIRSIEMLETLERHGINVMCFHLYGKSYCLINEQRKMEEFIRQLQTMMPNEEKLMNQNIQKNLGDLFKRSLELMDTKRDRDTMKAVMSMATSSRFTAQLQGVQNTTAISNSRNQLAHNLNLLENIELTSIPVRSDLTNLQQFRLWKRIVAVRKRNELRLRLDCRGRSLKAEDCPEFISMMETFFDGPGMEAHPRLSTTTLFRPACNNLFMRQARNAILMNSPEHFSISLSSCYNYTMNYKENSGAAKRHHHGKNVNADISLKRPPRNNTKMVINIHWTASNINHLLYTENQDIMIDSKDAKCIVIGDNTPVQKPGKSWKSISAPDHDWDQSRTNAVTPMSHLFLSTKEYSTEMEVIGSEKVCKSTVTRSGKACTLVNLSYFEADDTFRRFNEIFLLSTLPSLDLCFRSDEGVLRSTFAFLVDNGPGEGPSSFLVQMLLVRLLKYLNLDKVTQRSFAEYHSKRNFVERVHATENDLLSRHGPFDSHQIHKKSDAGSSNHKENMERMAKDVIECISAGTYSQLPVTVHRGMEDCQYLFDDEKNLRQFFQLSEEMKQSCEMTYTVKQNEIHHELVQLWGACGDFHRKYRDDYNILINGGDQITCWKDKYSCTIYRDDELWRGSAQNRYESQPLPDFVKWRETGELHYLSKLKADMLPSGEWDKQPELFLPSRIIDLILRITLDPPSNLLSYISLLCFVPQQEVALHIQERNEKENRSLEDAIKQETYRHDPLYKKLKSELINMCKVKNIQTKDKKKHELVEVLLERENKSIPNPYKPKCFSKCPNSLTDISKLNLADCRFLLRGLNLSTIGTKDEMVMRLFLVKSKRAHLALKTQVTALQNLISVVEELIFQEQKLVSLGVIDEIQVRKFSSTYSISSLKLTDTVTQKDLINLFSPLKSFITSMMSTDLNDAALISEDRDEAGIVPDKKLDDYDQFFEIGTKIKVRWTKEEVEDLGWRGGWYVAHITSVCKENDCITIVYSSEPDSVYEVEVSVGLEEGTLRIC